MGRTIEVILAFAGIMLGLSLAITVLNQLVSNALGSRGSTLKWGLVTMLQQLHEPMNKKITRGGRTAACDSAQHPDRSRRHARPRG